MENKNLKKFKLDFDTHHKIPQISKFQYEITYQSENLIRVLNILVKLFFYYGKIQVT